MESAKFTELLTRQVGNEFAASHQYVAVAAWFAGRTFPSWPNTSTASRWKSATTP
jgi:ferritin